MTPSPLPQTSFTISIDAPEVMVKSVREGGYSIIKVKLGSDNPEGALAAIRSATNARLRVDANAGWSSQQALDLIPRLEKYDLELVEQPLPTGDVESYRWLHSELQQKSVKLPIFCR